MDLRTFIKNLLIALLFSVAFTFTYSLRSNSYPASFIALFTFFFMVILLPLKKTASIHPSVPLFSTLFVYLFAYTSGPRTPSFADFLFFFSFSPFFYQLFIYFLFGNRNPQNFIRNCLISLLPVFPVWAFAANSEFPPTLSPLVLNGMREAGWILSVVFFSIGIALMTHSHSEEKTRRKTLLKQKAFMLLTLLLVVFFLIYDVYSAHSTVSYLTANLLKTLTGLSVLAGIIFSVGFSLIADQTATETQKERNFGFLFLIPPVFITLGYLSKFVYTGPALPFSLTEMILVILFSFAGWAAYERLLQRNTQALALLPFLLPLAVLFFLRLFLFAEMNDYYHNAKHYSFVSAGYEHLGPWFYLIMLLIIAMLGRSYGYVEFLLLSVFSISSIPFYYERLYHYVNVIPVSAFRDLGAEGVSWIRKPIIALEPYLTAVFSVIIFTLLSINNLRAHASEND